MIHGTVTGYTHHRCRCNECTAANTESRRQQAVELAHIKPRGMGHTGYRDTLGNVNSCLYFARSDYG